MNKKYRPANGSEGDFFMAAFCEQCKKYGYSDETPEKTCPILMASMAFEIEDAGYPSEWIRDDDGGKCTSFEADA
jgi:hypothetical protein